MRRCAHQRTFRHGPLSFGKGRTKLHGEARHLPEDGRHVNNGHVQRLANNAISAASRSRSSVDHRSLSCGMEARRERADIRRAAGRSATGAAGATRMRGRRWGGPFPLKGGSAQTGRSRCLLRRFATGRVRAGGLREGASPRLAHKMTVNACCALPGPGATLLL